jgi:DNA-directed RNA polymerase delta subunit
MAELRTLVDACRFVLEDQGEAQSAYWPASIMEEMKLWREGESRVRAALDRDIKEHGESSLFVKVGDDQYGLRSWMKG